MIHDEHKNQLPKYWSLPLEHIEDHQILYNGKFSYLTHYRPSSGGWCHLLLLRSRNRSSDQKIAIVTQVPDCVVSIVNTIEHIAGFVISFFNRDMTTNVADGLMGKVDETAPTTPDNTTFIEYLPAYCFGENSGHDSDTVAVMTFDWELVQPHTAPGTFASPYYRASKPEWNQTVNQPPRKVVTSLIRNL
jgi:hypothetical protein